MTLISPSIVRLERPIEECARVLNGLGCESVHVDVCQESAFPGFFNLNEVQSGSLRAFNGSVTMHFFQQEPTDYQIDLSFLRDDDLAVLHVFPKSEVDSVSAFLEAARSAGCRPGLSLDLKIDSLVIEACLSILDTIFVMGIPVATFGLQLDEITLTRVASMHKLFAERNQSCRLGLDGGVNATTFPELTRLADELVVGSLLFHTDDIVAQWAALNSMAKGAENEHSHSS